MLRWHLERLPDRVPEEADHASAWSDSHRHGWLWPGSARSRSFQEKLHGKVVDWIEEIRPGDVVWISPAEKHWHGASPT